MTLVVTRGTVISLARDRAYDWMTALAPVRQALRASVGRQPRSCCGKRPKAGAVTPVDRRVFDQLDWTTLLDELRELKTRERHASVIVNLGASRHATL